YEHTKQQQFFTYYLKLKAKGFQIIKSAVTCENLWKNLKKKNCFWCKFLIAKSKLFLKENCRSDIKNFSATTGTSNLTAHLEQEHNIRDEVTLATSSSRMMQSFFAPIPKVASATLSTTSTKRKLVIDITMLCCRDLFPFNVVDGQGFLDFCKKYGIMSEPTDMPIRTTISRCLDFVYQNCKAEVIKCIAEYSPNDVSYTFDQWTDRYRRRPYSTNTLHYWDKDFNAINLTLKTNYFPKRHTGENILSELELVLDEFGIQNKNVCMVTDAANNVRKALRIGKYDNHLCWGHGMHNLVYTDGSTYTQSAQKERIQKHVSHLTPYNIIQYQRTLIKTTKHIL
ncbi:Transposable element Hobo transposase, partial [Pseudolycoriella hygida]